MNFALSAPTSSRSGSFRGATFTEHFRALRRRAQNKRDANSLRALDERTLRDMGIDRSEILSVVYADARERRTRYA